MSQGACLCLRSRDFFTGYLFSFPRHWTKAEVLRKLWKVFMSLKCVVKATVSKIKPCWLWHRLKEEKKLVRSVQLWVWAGELDGEHPCVLETNASSFFYGKDGCRAQPFDSVGAGGHWDGMLLVEGDISSSAGCIYLSFDVCSEIIWTENPRSFLFGKPVTVAKWRWSTS